MRGTDDAVVVMGMRKGHWERVADEVQGLALLRGVRVPLDVLEWLDIRELLTLRSLLLEPGYSGPWRRRVARIAGLPVVAGAEHRKFLVR